MLSKLEQIIEKELNNRKVYEDANDVIKAIKGLAQTEKETKDLIVKALAEKDVLLKEVDSLKKQTTDQKAKLAAAVKASDEKIAADLDVAKAKVAKIETDALATEEYIKKSLEEHKSAMNEAAKKKEALLAEIAEIENKKNELKKLLG